MNKMMGRELHSMGCSDAWGARLLGLGLISPFFAGCALEGSGEIEERDFAVEAFDEVAIGRGFHAVVEQGSEHFVTVRADENLMDHVKVQSEGGVLRVEMDKDFAVGTLELKLVMPELRAAKVDSSMLEGRAIAAADTLRLEADAGYFELSLAEGETVKSLTIDAQGDSNMRLDGCDAQAATLSLKDSSVHLEGKTETFQASVVDSSTLTGKFESEEVEFFVKGDSEGNFFASEKAKGEAKERARVSVSGDALVDVDVSQDSDFVHDNE